MMRLALTLWIVLLLCGCATKTPPAVPPALRNIASRRMAATPAVETTAVIPARQLSLYWEHDGQFTTGFAIERTFDVGEFTAIGFVPVSQPWATNATDFTFRFPLTNEPPAKAFYRVGAMPQ